MPVTGTPPKVFVTVRDDLLIRQAAFFGDLTAHTLKLAGLGPGMRVLDVGCGAGDVSLLAASIVGPSGSVTGVDMNADTVKVTQSRIAGAKVANVTIEAGDITKLPYAGEFDAVIGRLIVLYLGDPVAGMQAFRGYVKPGGLIYFQEFGRPQTTSMPPVPLHDKARGWIEAAFERGKIDLYMGMRLAGLYRAAGLPAPSMLAMSRVETGPDSPIYEYMAQTVSSLLPLIERTGVATRDAGRHRHAGGAHARTGRGGQCGPARPRAHRRLDARAALTFV